MKPIVHIIDDDHTVLDALSRLFESIEIAVLMHTSIMEFLDEYDPIRPSCVVSDIRMPEVSGLNLLKLLSERGHEIPVIFLTGYGTVEMGVKAMKDGALDFFEKPVNDQQLLDRVAEGLKESQSRIDRQYQRKNTKNHFAQLTKREREVLELVVAGDNSKEIADKLTISKKTVDFHRSNIMQKTKSRSLAGLIKSYLSINTD